MQDMKKEFNKYIEFLKKSNWIPENGKLNSTNLKKKKTQSKA
jgi:hypothetical protein